MNNTWQVLWLQNWNLVCGDVLLKTGTDTKKVEEKTKRERERATQSNIDDKTIPEGLEVKSPTVILVKQKAKDISFDIQPKHNNILWL